MVLRKSPWLWRRGPWISLTLITNLRNLLPKLQASAPLAFLWLPIERHSFFPRQKGQWLLEMIKSLKRFPCSLPSHFPLRGLAQGQFTKPWPISPHSRHRLLMHVFPWHAALPQTTHLWFRVCMRLDDTSANLEFTTLTLCAEAAAIAAGGKVDCAWEADADWFAVTLSLVALLMFLCGVCPVGTRGRENFELGFRAATPLWRGEVLVELPLLGDWVNTAPLFGRGGDWGAEVASGLTSPFSESWIALQVQPDIGLMMATN